MIETGKRCESTHNHLRFQEGHEDMASTFANEQLDHGVRGPERGKAIQLDLQLPIAKTG
jgi:hypothetical protein